MIKTNYLAIIPYKIKDVIALIMDNKKQHFLEAVRYLYISELYKYLSKEETKFWHFSSYKLFDLLEEEKQNNMFELPDFV